jgi:hypothetical protein
MYNFLVKKSEEINEMKNVVVAIVTTFKNVIVNFLKYAKVTGKKS